MQIDKNNDNIQYIARLSGFAYLGVIIFALFAEAYVRGSNVFPSDVVKTAANIIQNENMWRFAMVADVFTIVCDLVLASVFYILLRPISHTFSFMAAFFRVSAVTVLAIAAIFHYAPMYLVGDNPLNNSFTPAQTQNLIVFMIKLHNVTYHISLILFGVNCVLLGFLFYKSMLVPKIIGIMLFICGFAYFFNSVFHFILPKVQDIISTPALLFCLIAEASLTFWLIIKGVDMNSWEKNI